MDRGGRGRGLCRYCVSFAKWIPVVFIVSIVVWSYYAYVVQLCLLTVQEIYVQIPMLVLYHICFTLFAWSYWKTIFTNSGGVPNRFNLTDDDVDRIENSGDARRTLERLLVERDLPCTMRSIQQEVRYCSECSIVKPDRAHHCSVCGKCVLKMDHHCPWVNNCVAFMNYKFFILFLGYALLYCIYVALSSLRYFLEFWSSTTSGGQGMGGNEHGRFHVLFLFFVSAMFSISLASLFGYHLYLVTRNMTTLEAFRPPVFGHGPDKYAFNLGKLTNFQEVFGDIKWMWFFPLDSHIGDGLTFPQRNQPDEEAGLLNGNGFNAANPSSNSPPAFASEESVPMMLQHTSETEEVELNNTTRNTKGDWQHITSSSGSSVNSGATADATRTVTSANLANSRTTEELVSVNM